jgi:hypothetical protein
MAGLLLPGSGVPGREGIGSAAEYVSTGVCVGQTFTRCWGTSPTTRSGVHFSRSFGTP